MNKCKSCSTHHAEINPKSGKTFSRCNVCRARRVELDKRKRTEGLCRDCGGVAGGKARCLACNRKLKKAIKDKGKCMSCCGHKDRPGSLCKRCILKNIARKSLSDSTRWTELQELFDLQQGLCAVTQTELQIGVNASIDHIVPSNRGGSDSLHNLRWVHIVFNRMKNDMLDSELMEWIRLIYDTLPTSIQQGPPCDLNAPAGRIHSWPSGVKTTPRG